MWGRIVKFARESLLPSFSGSLLSIPDKSGVGYLARLEWWRNEVPELGFVIRVPSTHREAILEAYFLWVGAHLWAAKVNPSVHKLLRKMVGVPDYALGLASTPFDDYEASVRVSRIEGDPFVLLWKWGQPVYEKQSDELPHHFSWSFSDWYTKYQGEEELHYRDVVIHLPEGPYYWTQTTYSHVWKTRLGFVGRTFEVVLDAEQGEEIPVPSTSKDPLLSEPSFIHTHSVDFDTEEVYPATIYSLLGKVLYMRGAAPAYTGAGKYSKPMNQA